MARKYINNQTLLFERIKKAQEAIHRSKFFDGSKNGLTIEEIWKRYGDLKKEYYEYREKTIYEIEQLNGNPNELPSDFVSKEDLLKEYGIKEETEYIEFDGMQLTPLSNAEEFLDSEIIDELIQRWYNAHGREEPEQAVFYFNDTFHWNILGYQRQTIRNGQLEKIDFIITAQDKPLLYKYETDKPVIDRTELDVILSDWAKYEEEYNQTMKELELQEISASRGDYMISHEEPYGKLYEENGQEIFEVSSTSFWDHVDHLYLLSEEHPEYFQKGASIVIDGLYTFYKDEMYGLEREMSKDYFELKATQQFLYMSNEDKQIRIDLFRHIDPETEKAGEVFTGGLFHIFDHFEGLRFSTKNKGDYTLQEYRLFDIIRDLFFNHLKYIRKKAGWGEESEAENRYLYPVKTDEAGNFIEAEKNWKAVFTKHLKKDLYYIDTMYIDD